MELTERPEATRQEGLLQEPVVLWHHGAYFVQISDLRPVCCGIDQRVAGRPRRGDKRFDPLSAIEKGLYRNQLGVSGWFAGLWLDEVRRRFRANLEIDGVEPFWEDRLVGPAGTEVPFRIGSVRWLGVKACQRCVVPTRSSLTAEVTREFQKTFSTERGRTLPAWATRERFDHFYRLAVNTRPAPDQPAADQLIEQRNPGHRHRSRSFRGADPR